MNFRILIFLSFIFTITLSAQDAIDRAIQELPAKIKRLHQQHGNDHQAVSDAIATELGKSIGSVTLDPERFQKSLRKVISLIQKNIPGAIIDPYQSYSLASRSAFQTYVEDQLASPELASASAEERLDRVSSIALTALPKMIATYSTEEEAAWLSSAYAWRTCRDLKLGHADVDESYLRVAGKHLKELSPKLYALAMSSSLNSRETFKKLAEITYQNAIRAGATEEEAREAALLALTYYARRSLSKPEAAMVPGLATDAAYKYTNDPARLAQLARDATRLAGADSVTLRNLIDSIHTRMGDKQIDALPSVDYDLEGLKSAIRFLNQELTILETDPKVDLDESVAEMTLAHLTNVIARLGYKSELRSGAYWTPNTRPLPKSLIGWSKAYKSLYSNHVIRLRKNGMITDNAIAVTEHNLQMQQMYMQINKAMMDLSSLSGSIDKGFGTILKEAIPGNADTFYDSVLSMETTYNTWLAVANLSKTSLTQPLDLSDPPPVEMTQYLKSGHKVVKSAYKDVYLFKTELSKLRKTIEELREQGLTPNDVAKWNNLRAYRSQLNAKHRVIMKGPVKSVISFVNDYAVIYAKQKRKAYLVYLEELKSVSAKDQKHLMQVIENAGLVFERMQEIAQLSGEAQGARERLLALYASKSHRSYHVPATQAPEISLDYSENDLAKIETHYIGKALQIYNSRIAYHTANVLHLTPRLIVRPADHPSSSAYRLIAESLYQESHEQWFISGGGKNNHWSVHDIDELGNGSITSYETMNEDLNRSLDIAIVFDTTGSMNNSITSLKEASKEMIATLKRDIKDIRIGLVQFTDTSIAPCVTTPFSNDLTKVMTTIDGWKTSSGGDYPESQLHGLYLALNQLKWRKLSGNGRPVAKAIIVVSDDESKPLNIGGKNIGVGEIIKMANLVGNVRIYPVTIGKKHSALALANQLATGTSGRIIPLQNQAEAASIILTTINEAAISGDPRYFRAPEKFRGDLLTKEAHTLTYQIKSSTLSQQFEAPDVVLHGGGHVLTYRHHRKPGNSWTEFQVPLSEFSGWTDTSTNRPASPEVFKKTLSDVTRFQIRAEYSKGNDKSQLDNVRLYARPSIDGNQLLKDIEQQLVEWKNEVSAEAIKVERAYAPDQIRSYVKSVIPSKSWVNTILQVYKLDERMMLICDPQGGGSHAYSRMYSITSSELTNAIGMLPKVNKNQQNIENLAKRVKAARELWQKRNKSYQQATEKYRDSLNQMAVIYYNSLVGEAAPRPDVSDKIAYQQKLIEYARKVSTVRKSFVPAIK